MAGIDSYTKLMLHMNSDFSDSSDSNHTPTIGNGASIDTIIKKFGAGSGKFVSASSQYVQYPDSADWDYGSNDFTFDLWARTTDISLNQILIDHLHDANHKVSLQFNVSELWLFFQNGVANDIRLKTTGFAWANNTQYHIAVTRNGGNLYLYQDGIQKATTSVGFSAPSVTADLGIGGRAGSGAAPFSGNLDELRISKGIARWTSNFTPPTEEYTGNGVSNTIISRRRIEGE